MPVQPDGRLTLPGTTHNLEVRRVPDINEIGDEGLLLRVWSPSVLHKEWAEAVLNERERRELAAYFLEGLDE